MTARRIGLPKERAMLQAMDVQAQSQAMLVQMRLQLRLQLQR